MKKIKTDLRQKILLLMLSIFLTAVIIKAGFGKLVFISTQSYLNYKAAIPKGSEIKTYKILTLGESTTAGFYFSWPTLMEMKLNTKSKFVRFVVFNKALPATDTLYMVGNLRKNIDKYNPDIVITMMGVNDDVFNYQIIYDSSKDIRKNSSWLQLQVLRFQVFWEVLEESILNEWSSIDIVGMDRKVDNDARNIYVKYFSINGSEKKSVFHNYTDAFGIPVILRENLTTYEKTKYHYNIFFDILEEKNIQYVAMQYPMLDVGIIKTFFDERKRDKIIFVSNKEVFEEALKMENPKDYFIDDFGKKKNHSAFKGEYGHTTVKGSDMIAENAVNTILAYLNITQN